MKTLSQREREIEEAELFPFRLAAKLEADVRTYCQVKHLPASVLCKLNVVSITFPNNTTVTIEALGSKVAGSESVTWWKIDNTEVTEDQMLDAVLRVVNNTAREQQPTNVSQRIFKDNKGVWRENDLDLSDLIKRTMDDARDKVLRHPIFA